MFKIRFRPITHSPRSQGPAWISLLSVQIPVLTSSATILTHAGCRIRTWQAELSFPEIIPCFKLQGLMPPRNFWRISEFIYKQEMLYPGLLVYSANRVPFPSHILTLEISFTISCHWSSEISSWAEEDISHLSYQCCKLTPVTAASRLIYQWGCSRKELDIINVTGN